MNTKEIKDLDNVEMLNDSDHVIFRSAGLGKTVKMLASKMPFIRKDIDEYIDGKKLFRGIFGTTMETRQHVGLFTFAGGDTGNAINLVLRSGSGNIGGSIKVRLVSGFRGAAAYGVIEKVFNVYYLASSNNLFVAGTLVPLCSKACGEQWSIGDIAAVDGSLVIPIVNRTGKSNDVRISVEMIKYITSIPEITLSDPYTYAGVVPNNLTELVFHPGDLDRLKSDLGFGVKRTSVPSGGEIDTGMKDPGLYQISNTTGLMYCLFMMPGGVTGASILATSSPNDFAVSDTERKVTLYRKENGGNLFIKNNLSISFTLQFCKLGCCNLDQIIPATQATSMQVAAAPKVAWGGGEVSDIQNVTINQDTASIQVYSVGELSLLYLELKRQHEELLQRVSDLENKI